MPNRPPKPCTRCGRPAKLGNSLCEKHLAQMRANSDAKRGTSTERGYGARHEGKFRQGVFARYGTECVWAFDDTDHPPLCGRHATHADHYPIDRRTLVGMGHDPDDPQHGRPLCEYHHNKHTGQTQGRLAKGNPR